MEEGQLAPPDSPMFGPGDMVVHPAHGVGHVLGIESRNAGGHTTAFYVMKILESGLKLMVAVEAARTVGLRSVMSADEALNVFQILRAPDAAIDVQPWARRQRVYAEMLKSGSPYEIAKVLRDMSRLKFTKDLSFAERRLLDQAKALLLHELALAKNVQRASIEGELKTIFSA